MSRESINQRFWERFGHIPVFHIGKWMHLKDHPQYQEQIEDFLIKEENRVLDEKEAVSNK